MDLNNIIQRFSIIALPLIAAIVLHEVGHGWVACKKGDTTAKDLGRLTLNPIAHIDLFGTIILPLILLISNAGFFFAYAKPVPVNFARLNNPKKDMILVAGAGPLINLGLAFISTILFKILGHLFPLFSFASSNHFIFNEIAANSSSTLGFIIIPVLKMLQASITINIVLAVINLIPIPPIDGGRILVGLLPDKQAAMLSKIEPFGIIILLILFIYDPLGIFSYILIFFVNIIYYLLLAI